MRRLHDAAMPVLARAGLSHDACPMLGIHAAVASDPDLREPHPAHRGRLAVAQLERHADTANVPVAVVPERPLAGEEALHRRQRNAPDVPRRGALEKPEGHRSSAPLRTTAALARLRGAARAVVR